ncbi:hypothetical protein GCM10011499_27080 [Pelagibacterium lentulum]|uniref:Uncharacterized protein n=1 Tax=Pelagibacterium lentulum TaxID=2029865 RepID=A0A916RG91_9HYPH|nr:hypothetical protein GCM10011499_27080 [Pelagibacterium lentulum]
MHTLPGAPEIVHSDGGTPLVLYRKDRVTCAKGADLMGEVRLKPDSKTRRVVATCCNSPMFLEFTNGHWLSIYAGRLPEAERPPLEIRTMTRDRPGGADFDDDIPSPKTHTGKFMFRLLGAWLAMGFRTPKINYVKGTLNGQV